MHRVFVPADSIRDARIEINDLGAMRHLRTVLRVKSGDRLVCVDGQGCEYEGPLIELSPQRLVLQIDARRARHEPGPLLWLAQGIPKGARFDWAVEKATELGAARIVPLLTKRTVVRMSEGGSASKLTRWRRLAESAARQCQRTTLPVIEPPQSLEAFLATVPRGSMIVMPTLRPGLPTLSHALRQVQKDGGPVVILIGPEGDFTQEEVAAAQTHGAQPVSLGTLTLRSETAAAAALAMVRYAFGCP